MYIHLGEDISVRDSSVIGLFDLENTTIGPDTRAFLNKLEQSGRVVSVSDEMPKSFVICMEKGEETVYISSISAATLRKRAGTRFSILFNLILRESRGMISLWRGLGQPCLLRKLFSFALRNMKPHYQSAGGTDIGDEIYGK